MGDGGRSRQVSVGLARSSSGARRRHPRPPHAPATWPVPYWQIDTAFATMLLLLAAADAGLGALFFGVFRNAERLLDVLGAPAGHELIGAVALGRPLDDETGQSADRPRRPLDEVVHRGRW